MLRVRLFTFNFYFSSPSLSPSQADYLQPKLLGILAFFNMQLLSSSVGIEDKKMVRKFNF